MLLFHDAVCLNEGLDRDYTQDDLCNPLNVEDLTFIANQGLHD